MSSESAASRASQIARQMLLFGRPVSMDELMERLSLITVERLADLSARLFSTRPTVAAVGPVGSLAAFEDIVGLLPDRQSAMRVVAG
jgi:predicted Zn-dependent peptidase